MRRLCRAVCALPAASRLTHSFSKTAGGPVNATSSFAEELDAEKASQGESEAHPLLYNVPALSARTVGREAEITALWQHLLSGHQRQVLVGVDGIGKSTIASEFCDAARKSGRFTCIQWFNGQHALRSQLERFFSSMRGRREKDVLLVLDDVADPEELVQVLPEHKNVYVVMTSSNPNCKHSARLSVQETLALTPSAAEALSVEVDGLSGADDVVKDVLDTVGYVPILVHLAANLMATEAVAPTALLEELRAAHVMQDRVLSVSAALRVLVEFGVRALQKDFPEARRHLSVLSCFHLSDLSDAVISSACGDAGPRMAAVAAQLGLLSLKWEDSAFSMHASVASVLQAGLTADHLHAAASALTALWPRRWRGMGSHLAYNLVWHTYALSLRFQQHGAPLTAELMTCIDRSATFLAHNEARDLAVAAELWFTAFEHNAKEGSRTPESVRIARECGRLLHCLRDPRAEKTLRAAVDMSAAVYGEKSAETALIMGCYAPYLPATEDSLARLTDSTVALRARLTSVDYVLGKEETRMLLETLFVLTVCKGQIMQELGNEVPEALWEELDAIKEQLGPIQSA